ncbi:MAG: hypothetical protein ABFC31_04030 [Clostridiaceae bacterium]
MLNALESEIRSRLAEAVSRASGFAFGAQDVHLPARHAAASLRPPNGAPTFPPESVSAKLFGAEMVESCRMVNGWLLLDLSAAFYDALTAHVNTVFPPPLSDGGRHAVNRMLVLARHGGKGCPQIPAVQRALLLCVCAGQNRASLERAEQAVGTMFRSIPPKDRTALLAESGALGSACARLLLFAAAGGLPQLPFI